jgi:hypothetical protein
MLKRITTCCSMPDSAGPEGDEEDMSDDGDEVVEDEPEDDVQDDAIHAFQGHSGLRMLHLPWTSACPDIARLA